VADSDCVLSQGETLQDIADLDNFKSAMRAAEIAQQLATPWNKSIAALNSYLINSDYCGKDLAGRANRAAILTEFVNYIFTQNAENWRSGDPFLATADVATHWAMWFAASAASKILPQAPEKKKFFQFRSRGGGGQDWRQGHNLYHADGFLGGGQTDSRHGGPSGGQHRAGGGGFGGQQSDGADSRRRPQSQHGQRTANSEEPCRRFNAGVCPNRAGDCYTAAGIRLLHVCTKDVNGRPCGRDHPEVRHR
jgi:hypothetical protein